MNRVPFIFRVLSFIPLWILYGTSTLIAFTLEHLVSYRKGVIRTNLMNAFPDIDSIKVKELMREYYAGLADLMVEILKTPNLTSKALKRRIEWRNPEILEHHAYEGRNVIIMMGHSGNWEWAGLATAQKFGFKMMPVYRKIKSPLFNAFFLGIRSRFGAQPIIDKEAPTALATVDELFASAMLADQTPGAKKAWWLRFLNQPTPFFRGSEVLAKRLNSVEVVYAHIHRTGRGQYSIQLENPPQNWRGTSGALTIGFAKFLEKEILKDRANWLWSHRRWKHKPTDESRFID